MVQISKFTNFNTNTISCRMTSPVSFYNNKKLIQLQKKRFFSINLLFPLILFLLMNNLNVIKSQSDDIKSNYYSYNDNTRGCVCDGLFNADDNYDYFNDTGKVEINYAKNFAVTYHNNYKRIVVGTDTSDETNSHIIYATLCGTTLPSDEELTTMFGDEDDNRLSITKVDIPLRNIAVGSTTYIPLVAYVGQRENIKYVKAESSTFTPCIKKLFDDGELAANDDYSGISTDIVKDLADNKRVDVIFEDYGYSTSKTTVESINYDDKVNVLPVLEYAESTVLGNAEWVEYFSLFFNRETAANAVASNIELRFNCSSEKVKNSDSYDVNNKPKVLISANYGIYGYGATSCPSWKCEMVEAAGKNI